MLSFVAFIAEDNDSYLAFEKAEVVSAKALRDMNYSGFFEKAQEVKDEPSQEMSKSGSFEDPSSSHEDHGSYSSPSKDAPSPTRLAPVTIPALQDQGVHTFAWMMKNEFGLDAPHGAFLYCSEGEKVYLALQPFRSAHQQHEEEVKEPIPYKPSDADRE